MPVCDLDKRVPTAKRVMGLDIVVWWDRNENESEWRVFNDAFPHRLAPLSEGRIDQWGRLQCVYHMDGASMALATASSSRRHHHVVLWSVRGWILALPIGKGLIFLPTKSDAQVAALRRWLTKYSGGGIKWGGKFSGALPPTPPREQLMDRYRSHVVNCSSCSLAYKSSNALEVMLQVISIGLIGIVAATKQKVMSAAARTSLVLIAILFFAASRWLSHFIYKTFHFHDYNHALQ